MHATELKQQDEKILDSLALAVFLVDENLCVKYLNPAGEEIIGTGVRHALHRPLTDFIQDNEGNLIQQIRNSIENGHPITQREVSLKRLVQLPR
jgi:two-component system nitrogen regulation sensor histidine kinase GlnL